MKPHPPYLLRVTGAWNEPRLGPTRSGPAFAVAVLGLCTVTTTRQAGQKDKMDHGARNRKHDAVKAATLTGAIPLTVQTCRSREMENCI